MLQAPGVRKDAAASTTSVRGLLLGAHVAAGAVVVVGIAVQVWRPLAPDLGAVPPATAWFGPGHLAEVRAYRTPLYVAGAMSLLLQLGVMCGAAFTAAGRRLTDRVVRRVGPDRPARAGAAVVVAIVVVADLLVLPLAFWAGYVHEGAFGFRTQGLAGWVYDRGVTTIGGWLAAGALALGGFALARRLPRAWPPVAGIVGAGLAAVLVFASPLVLEPLLYDTEPVPPGPLRREVEAVVERAGQPAERISVADASRRTTKRNAYVSGLGASREVVLFDTLVDNQTPREIGLVLAHELAHVAHADLLRGTLFAASGTVTVAYLLAGIVAWRTRRGRQVGAADPHAAAVLVAVAALASVVSAPLQTAVSRRAEAAADFTALELTRDPAAYLRKTEELARANLSDPSPPRLVHLLWSTHPSASARLEMGRQWQEASTS